VNLEKTRDFLKNGRWHNLKFNFLRLGELHLKNCKPKGKPVGKNGFKPTVDFQPLFLTRFFEISRPKSDQFYRPKSHKKLHFSMSNNKIIKKTNNWLCKKVNQTDEPPSKRMLEKTSLSFSIENTSVSNEKKFEPKFPKNRNKIEASVSSKNFGENRNFLFTFVFMPKFINFYLLLHSNQIDMTNKSLIFA
jgi:hypothetical protein